MKINLLFTGKTKIAYIEEGTADYLKRLKHYINCNQIIVTDLKNTKNMSEAEIKRKEGENILKAIPPANFVVLFDEKGKELSSLQLSSYLDRKMHEGKDICLIVGGAYGFSEEVYARADYKMSLSKLTFSHQMIRMIIAEQIYRAFSILRNEPYHHQ